MKASRWPGRVPRRSGVFHGLASCEDCDWQTQDYKVALLQAGAHAKRTGHTVNAEQAVAVTFNPKGE